MLSCSNNPPISAPRRRWQVGTHFLFIYSTQGFPSSFVKCCPRWTTLSWRPETSCNSSLWHLTLLPTSASWKLIFLATLVLLSETTLFPIPLPPLWCYFMVFFSTINFKTWNFKPTLCISNLQWFWPNWSASRPLEEWENLEGRALRCPVIQGEAGFPAPARPWAWLCLFWAFTVNLQSRSSSLFAMNYI